MRPRYQTSLTFVKRTLEDVLKSIPDLQSKLLYNVRMMIGQMEVLYLLKILGAIAVMGIFILIILSVIEAHERKKYRTKK